jgi:hypothetical protein
MTTTFAICCVWALSNILAFQLFEIRAARKDH